MAVYTLTNLTKRIPAAIKRTSDQFTTGILLQGLLRDIIDSIKKYIDNAIGEGSGSSVIIVSKTVMLSEGVPFIVTFEEMDYDMTFNFYDDNGPVGGHFTAKTSTGFTVVSDVNCTFSFICVKNKYEYSLYQTARCIIAYRKQSRE